MISSTKLITTTQNNYTITTTITQNISVCHASHASQKLAEKLTVFNSGLKKRKIEEMKVLNRCDHDLRLRLVVLPEETLASRPAPDNNILLSSRSKLR